MNLWPKFDEVIVFIFLQSLEMLNRVPRFHDACRRDPADTSLGLCVSEGFSFAKSMFDCVIFHSLYLSATLKQSFESNLRKTFALAAFQMLFSDIRKK